MSLYDYRTYFKKWNDWEIFEERIDGINGVYAVRVKSEFGRIIGSSSILYIGKAAQNPGRNKR